ncbi:TetR/AcrR family transcriptional regulator [Nocardiopsis metallicus]
MSLYRHVCDKEELLREMIDTLHSRYAYPDPGDMDWRERMRLLARHDWDMYTAHPWLLTATATLAPPVGPHMLASMEWALAALEPLELTPEQAGRAIMAVTHYLQGSARLALGGEGDLDERNPGNAWRRRLSGDDLSAFPRVAALVDSASGSGSEARTPGSESSADADTGRADWVVSGLDMVLDGIAAQSGR